MTSPSDMHAADVFAETIRESLRGEFPRSQGTPEHIRNHLQIMMKRNGDFSSAEMAKNTLEKFDTHVANIAEKLVEALPNKMRANVNSQARIICAVSPEPFGTLLSDDDNHVCALVISVGFMVVLNKLAKFDVASKLPGAVVSCDVKEPSLLTRLDLQEFRDIVIKNYGQHKMGGPSILLNQNMHQDLIYQTLLQEAFIVGHEIAHYLDQHMLLGIITDMMGGVSQNESHRKEYAADILGLLLVRESNYLINDLIFNNQTRDLILISAMCQFFETLHNSHVLNNQSYEPNGHPLPIKRLVVLLQFHFGYKVRSSYESWLDNGGDYPDWHSLVENTPELGMLRTLYWRFDHM